MLPSGEPGSTVPSDATPDAPTLRIPVRVELAPDAAEKTQPASGAPKPVLRTAGRYVVEDEIGRGGMGVVYRAFDRDLRRQVAMKVLLQDLGVGKELAARFVEEAQAAAQLPHPGI